MKRCFDLRANLISIKVSTSHRKSTQVRAMLGQTESQVFNLRLLVTPFGQGFTSLLDQRTAQLLNRVTLRGCQDYLAVLAQITFWREKSNRLLTVAGKSERKPNMEWFSEFLD